MLLILLVNDEAPKVICYGVTNFTYDRLPCGG